MHLAVINHSPQVSAAQAQAMASSIGHQVRYDFAPAYGVVPVEVTFYANPATVPPGSYVIGIFQDADQPGALGYHTEVQQGTGIAIYGKVFTSVTLSQPGAQVLGGPLSITSVLSHEVLELLADPRVNGWCDTNNNELVALEVCDPVESDVYPGSVPGTTVSNFVLPAWFDSQAQSGRFDRMGNLTGPFQMTSGGYVVYRSGGAEQQAVARYGEEYPEWKKAGKLSPFARTAQRIAASSSPAPDEAPVEAPAEPAAAPVVDESAVAVPAVEDAAPAVEVAPEVEAPVAAEADASAPAPADVPAAQEDVPVQVAFRLEAPIDNPIEGPANPVEVEAPVTEEAPVEAPAVEEAPAEVPVDAEAPTEAPVEAEAPAEDSAQVEAPAEVAAEVPAEAPVEAEAPAQDGVTS